MLTRCIFSVFLLSIAIASSARSVDEFCLGPTGAWGELDGHMLRVTYIAPCSPAAGILEPDDRIFGANDFLFPEGRDPRPFLADAIACSTGRRRKGGLDLKVRRDGSRRINYRIVVRPVGTYGDSWPSDCEKSRNILGDACSFVNDHTRPGEGLSINALLLLASGDRAYSDYVRRSAYSIAGDREHGNELYAAYRLLFLCEYYLATGDATAWDKMNALCARLSRTRQDPGRSNTSPSAHHAPALWQALILSEECGLPVEEDAVKEAMNCIGCAGPTPLRDTPASLPELLWLPILANAAPDMRYREFLDSNLQQLELARTHDGAFFIGGAGASGQPECDTTAALAMIYAGHERNLRIMGKPRTVFGTQPPCESTAGALRLFRMKDWDQLSEYLESFSSSSSKSRDYAAGIRNALNDLEAETAKELKEIETTAQSGDLYVAGLHLRGLQVRMGKRLPSTARLRRFLSSPRGQARIDVGRAVYETLATYSMGCYRLAPATEARLRGLVNTGDECYDYMAGHILKRITNDRSRR